tara:strand:+ start:65 stop:565 length:501 start_codon:yes stop_codon:yes gene_type:complete
VKDLIFKSKVGNKEIKDKLLEQIHLIPTNPIVENDQNILHTDWNLPSAMHREYEKLFFEIIRPHLQDVTTKLGCAFYGITRLWFQKYGTKGHHGWHTHPGAQYSNVYYLECPEGGSTKFKDIDVNCEEGDLLSFPAFLAHQSPPCLSETPKTIISFNCDFSVVPFE